MPPSSNEWTGKTIADGRYSLQDKLGEGAMGAVYVAVQHPMDREVVIKFIKKEFASDEEGLARFKREIQLTANIEHPHTVRVYDCGDENGQPFLVTEYIRGRDLQEHLEDGPIDDTDRIIEISRQIASGLQAAHNQGIIHRDLKPSNIMVTDLFGEVPQVKVMDFGIAKPLNQVDQHRTATGMILGTPHYMSPEQCSGHPLDPRSDLYSLGIVMFQMATGELPFDAASLTGLLLAHVNSPAPDVRQMCPQLPEALCMLITQLLEKNPNARPSSASQVMSALEVLRGGPITSAPPESTVVLESEPPSAPPEATGLPTNASIRPTGPGRHGGRWLIALGLLGALIGVAGFWKLAVSHKPPRDVDAGTGAGTPQQTDTETLVALLSQPDEPTFPETCVTLSGDAETTLRNLLSDGDLSLSQLQAQPRSTETSLLIARTSDAPEEVERAAREVLSNCPAFSVGHNLLGNALLRQGRVGEAVAEYQKTMELSSDYLAPRFNLALVHLAAGRPGDAVGQLDKVLQAAPQYPEASMVRARALYQLQRYEEAASAITDHLKRNRGDGDAWTLAALALSKSGAPEEEVAKAWCAAKERGATIDDGLCPQ